MHKILRFFPLCLIAVSLVSCGEFVGYKDNDVDVGSVEEVRISMSQQKMQRFYSSVTSGNYTSCTVEKGRWRGDGEIRVRGYSSRLNHKKSFSLIIDDKLYILERGESTGGLYNRIAMRAYQLAGVSACDTESIALFLNDEYLGCYSLITYYSSEKIKGELYKFNISVGSDLGRNHPLVSYCEKKFPQDGNLSNLEHLFYACSSLSNDEWRTFVNTHVDVEKTAAYLVIHDFLTVTDTTRTNFYIQYDGKYRLIPWDNELCMIKKRDNYKLCTDNQLVERLGTVPELKAAYNQTMQKLFIGGGEECILDTLQSEAADMFDALAPAMEHDPRFKMDYQQFMAEKSYALYYLDKNTGRATEVEALTLH